MEIQNSNKDYLEQGRNGQFFCRQPHQWHAAAATFFSAKSRQGLGIGGLASCSRGGPMDSFETALLAKTKTDIAKKELILLLVLLSIPYQSI